MRRAPARPLAAGLARLGRDRAQQAGDQRIGDLQDGGRARRVRRARRDVQVPGQAEHQRVRGQQLELAVVARPVVLDETRQRFPADEHGERVAPRRLRLRPAEQDHVFGLRRSRPASGTAPGTSAPAAAAARSAAPRETRSGPARAGPHGVRAARRHAQPRGRVEAHVQIGAETCPRAPAPRRPRSSPRPAWASRAAAACRRGA